MQINLSWDSSTANAPTGFQAEVQNAAQQLDKAILNPITVTIQVGWNEIGGTPMTPNSGGLGGDSALYANLGYGTSAQINSQTVADLSAQLALNNQGITLSSASLPSGTLLISTAQAQVLGINYPSSAVGYSSPTNVDGSIGLAMPSYSTSSDMITAALHELAHALGRINGFTSSNGTSLTPLDLFTYSAPGVLWNPLNATPGYFSLDGGVTNLGSFSTSDAADFASIIDPFSSGGYGIDTLTPLDQKVLESLGFAVATQSDTLAPGVNATATAGTVYSGNGSDTVLYGGNESLYHISAIGQGTVIVQDTLASGSGYTSLTGVRAQFSDVTLALDMGATQSPGESALLLHAAFGSPALTDGHMLGSLIGYLDQGHSLQQGAQMLASSGNLPTTSSAFVSTIWQNVVGSPIDPGNLALYTQDLANGTFTESSLLALAAQTGVNQASTGLTTLAQNGLNFIAEQTSGNLNSLTYTLPSTHYTVNNNGNGTLTVTGGGSTDTLVNVQRIQFSDTTLAFDLGANQSSGEAALLLHAALGNSGVNNRSDMGNMVAYLDQGHSVSQTAQCMLSNGIANFGSNNAFVSAIWQNVVGSPIDPGNLALYTQDLANGTFTQASLLALASQTSINQATANLIGLSTHGVAI